MPTTNQLLATIIKDIAKTNKRLDAIETKTKKSAPTKQTKQTTAKKKAVKAPPKNKFRYNTGTIQYDFNFIPTNGGTPIFIPAIGVKKWVDGQNILLEKAGLKPVLDVTFRAAMTRKGSMKFPGGKLVWVSTNDPRQPAMAV